MRNQEKIDFEVIKKYCGQEMGFRLQGALNNLQINTVKIVNTGMVSSGKSSLYNLLTDNATNERFPTGAARTTTAADTYSYNNMEYIDTPGIDVRDADDEIAYRTVMESDIILMVHNIKTGPLIRSEIDWLRRIAAGMQNPEMCKHRMIFVCTWKDTREKEDGYEEILNEVKQMAFEAVGTDIPFFDVSIKKYLDGVNKGKKALCEKSGIEELKAFIDEYVEQYAGMKREYAALSFEQIAAEVHSLLVESRNKKSWGIEQKEKETKQKFSSQRHSWKGICGYFKGRREALENLKQELKSI